MAITSLPSDYGIGTLGDAAFNFVDLLVDLKQRYWQILPIGPTSFGDSPYQSISAFAGNPYLIDLDDLVRDGLLMESEIRSYNWGADEKDVDYANLFENRFQILKKAFERFDTAKPSFRKFEEDNDCWLADYALFMAHHGELEYGSPKKPALAEALALNFADNTDAKLETFKEALKSNNDNNDWLGYNRLFESNIRKTSI